MIEISCKEVIDGIEWNSSYEGETSEILTQLGICVVDTLRNITADINESGGSATLEDIYLKGVIPHPQQSRVGM